MAAAALIGCGSAYDATVQGVARFNQAPLQSGTVAFIPQQSGPSGYGMIGSDGSYSIMTGREKGLPAGAYIVTVAANEPSIPDKNPSAPPKPGKPITPAWYRDAAQSPLKFTVSQGKNTIDLEMSSQQPPGWKHVRN
jgi:hypothetical protein